MSRFFVCSASAVLTLVLIVGCGKTNTGSPGATPADDGSADGAAATSEDSAPPADGSVSAGTPPGIGDPAPAWSALTGVDDQQHSLEDLADAKAVAVIFTCNHCPVAVAYEDRLVKLADDYSDKSFQLVAINVNNMEADKLPAMKERAEAKGFQFPYLYDPSQEIGRAYGATVTPHAFLLDEDRNLAYAGAIDDSQNPDEVENHYLRNAIDAVLAGGQPDPATTKQFGCGIRYE